MSWRALGLLVLVLIALMLVSVATVLGFSALTTWLFGRKVSSLLLVSLLALALFRECSRLPFAVAPVVGVALAFLYFALQEATSSEPIHRAGDALWWAVFFATIDGGKWLKRMAKKATASLTSIQELAFRREVQATR